MLLAVVIHHQREGGSVEAVVSEEEAVRADRLLPLVSSGPALVKNAEDRSW